MEAGMCSCDFEPADFWCETHRTARKAHSCCECGDAIQPGERYQRVAMKYDGCFDAFNTCLPCAAIRRDFCAPVGGLREILEEALGFDYVTGRWAAWAEEEE